MAGNVIGTHQLGSIEYAAKHVGCELVVVLGHTHCGAVDATLHHNPDGYIKNITDEIQKAIGEEKDEFRASCLNVKRSVSVIKENLCIEGTDSGLQVCGAMYHIDSGSVEFFD